MKIHKFIIEDYRAIDRLEINVSYSINPIVGVNESGKTSVLKAILAFDEKRDRFNMREHLIYQNKYSTKQVKECRISGELTLSKNELTDLITNSKVNTDSDEYEILKGFSYSTNFILTRILTESGNKYEFKNSLLSDQVNSRITKFLVNHLPSLLYFDDFSDRVPDEIDFPEDYHRTGKLTRNKLRDWQEIIEEIFKRADPEGIDDEKTTLQTYMNIEDSDRKGDILSDIEAELNEHIINEWKRIKKSSKSLADDSDKLTLSLIYVDGKFQFKVRDKSNNEKQRTFNISERSKGFQWFFNYMIKLKFNPNYTKEKENSIFLLDEPGSYLHSAAQKELLNELKRVSKKNTIIFCTHSQYLLNPDVIQLGSIKIAEKKDSKVSITDFGRHKSSKDQGALSPIYHALNMNFANDFLGKIIITEGVTDFFFFKMIQENTKFISKEWKIIPGSGAGQSSTLISLALAYASDFVLFLDNDPAGLDAKKKYMKEFSDHLDSYILIFNSDQKKFELEDFLCEEDQNKLIEITGTQNLKRSLGFLYYDYKNLQSHFITNLNDKTISNLSEVFSRLK